MMADKYYIGVDLGGTNIKAGVVAPDGKVAARTSISTEGERGPRHVIGRIGMAVETVISQSGLPREAIGGLCVGAPGTLDIRAGIVRRAPNLPGWVDIRVVEMVQERTGIRATLENDANAAAYGEFWVGASRNVPSMVMFTLGTGIGGGIIIDGRILHGNTDSAGEIGHMIIRDDGRKCVCGNWGCLEAYASALSLVRRFKEAVEAGEESVLAPALRAGADITSKAIFDAAIRGDGLSNRIYYETGVYIGIGVVNVLHTVNPARIVISGGMIGAGDLLMRPIRETVEKRALPDSKRNLEIVFAALGEDAGFIGGAGCALAAFGISR